MSAAATDPAADVTTLGIPLLPAELVALRASGNYLDASSPVALLTQSAETGRFGGSWIEPPGSKRYVVGILNSDPAAIQLIQCASSGVDVPYVAADQSRAALNALVHRIGADLLTLQANGIPIVSVGIGVRADVTVVVVGVHGLTDQIRAKLVEWYGPAIVTEEDQPAGF